MMTTMPLSLNSTFQKSLSENYETMKREVILIVEDDIYMNETLCLLLEEEGYIVHSAYDADVAISKLTLQKYDLLLLDYNLKGINAMNGIGVFEHAKKKYPGIIGIMISAYGESKMKELARSKGISRFLDKPLDIDDLVNQVKSCLNNKQNFTKGTNHNHLIN